MTKDKGQKDKQRSTKHTHKTKDRITRTPLKPGRELWHELLIVLLYGLVKHFMGFHPIFRYLNLIFPP